MATRRRRSEQCRRIVFGDGGMTDYPRSHGG
jgi:hypothetical protein